ncbi:MAG: hypothetical protein AB7P52_05280 [Alphaproteobacteria bacterium]
MRPPFRYKTGHRCRPAVCGGRQQPGGERGLRAAQPDLPVVHVDALDEVPDVALAQGGILRPELRAGRRREPGEVRLAEHPARQFALLIECGDQAQRFLPLRLVA